MEQYVVWQREWLYDVNRYTSAHLVQNLLAKILPSQIDIECEILHFLNVLREVSLT